MHVSLLTLPAAAKTSSDSVSEMLLFDPRYLRTVALAFLWAEAGASSLRDGWFLFVSALLQGTSGPTDSAPVRRREGRTSMVVRRSAIFA
jgi:hypothetical protein